MKRLFRNPVVFLVVLLCATGARSHAQHAFGLAGEYLFNMKAAENGNLGLRLSYDRVLNDHWTLRGMVGGMGGGQVRVYTAVPLPAFAGLPNDTVRSDERERYFHLTVGARRYVLGGAFSKGGAYVHLGVHLGFWSFTAETEAYDNTRYTIPALGPTEDDLMLVLFPVGVGYEWRAGKLVPYAELAYMPGTTVGDAAELTQGFGITAGLRFPFGEGEGK